MVKIEINEVSMLFNSPFDEILAIIGQAFKDEKKALKEPYDPSVVVHEPYYDDKKKCKGVNQ